jgi:uracil-DNA glycosylase family 4
LLVCGEAPGWNEVNEGVPFVGKSGQVLDQILSEHGLNREDVWATNVVMCRPTNAQGDDAPPTPAMIAACSNRLRDEIQTVRPKVILALGATAAQRLLNTKVGIGKIAGVLEIPAEFGIPVLPTYHPAAVLHGATGFFDNLYTTSQRAVQFVTGKLPIPGPYHVNWEFVTTSGRAMELFTRWEKQSRHHKLTLSIDTESHGPGEQPRPLEHTWDMFQIADEEGAYSFAVWGPFYAMTDKTWALFDSLLTENHIIWVMHNLAYDQQVLQVNRGKMARDVRDTMVLGLGLSERGEEVGLKAMSRRYLNAPFYEQGLPPGIFTVGPQNESEWWKEAQYGAYDAWNTRELARILPPIVRDEGTMELCRGRLLPAQQAFAEMGIQGSGEIDLDYAQEVEAEWLPLIQKAERDLKNYAADQGFPHDPGAVGAQQKAIVCPTCVGMSTVRWEPGPDRKVWRQELAAIPSFGDPSCPRCMKRRFVLVADTDLNPRSPKQLHHLCFDVLGMRELDGRRSVDKDFLEYNKHTDFGKLMLALREKDHLLRAYVYGIVDDVWSDGRIHPDFLLFGAVNGRLSIHNPPCQTLPKWGVADPTLAKMTRKLFRAKRGFVIVDADYKNLELFTAAHLTNDEVLYAALTEIPPGFDKADFHRATAATIFRKPLHEVTGHDRFNSKFVTFGIGYGRQAWSLAQGELFGITGGDERQAQEYIDLLWAKYRKWKAGYDEWQRLALEEGEIRIKETGRVRRWRLITPSTVNAIRNQAVNFPPASLASDINLSAMIRLQNILPKKDLGYPLFPVHDSLVFEIREDRLEEALVIIEREMTSPPFETFVKLEIEIDVGYNLGEVVPLQDWRARDARSIR